ncbi:hypothetical protein VIBNIWn13_100006 [Vibrio nigripulchritudo Wn13]|nr:hypothetical protein VIBNIBLFn1_210056 [Vibrio nigripulchritudo BLFn1]CCO50410.1 hypothetical protein VIBNIWn13_100006 [Vibrio nigripulchritudo Wn13]
MTQNHINSRLISLFRICETEIIVTTHVFKEGFYFLLTFRERDCDRKLAFSLLTLAKAHIRIEIGRNSNPSRKSCSDLASNQLVILRVSLKTSQ